MSTPLRVLLVDDEPLARQRLRGLVADLGQALPPLAAVVVAEAGDADTALQALQAQAAAGTPVDVLLLDIRMPGDSGLALAARLREQAQPPAVVFITAYAEHALKAFEVAATDYLTKPVRRDRLHEALLRVAQARRPAHAAVAAAIEAAPVLVVSDRGRVLRLPLHDVLVLRADQKQVRVQTPQHEHWIDLSLAEVEQRLAALGGDYLRIHRSALVARHAVRALVLQPPTATPGEGSEGEETLEGWAVQVAPRDEWLPVSRRQVGVVRAALAAPPPPA